jgi:RNA polymerase sigma-70 factor (ECF subfamily)
LSFNLCHSAHCQQAPYVKIMQRVPAFVRLTKHYPRNPKTLALDNVISLESKGSPHQQFEGLLRPHFEALYAAARRMALSQVDAEDLVQEVCIKAFLRLDEFTKIEYRKAWLLKMLYHQFIDLHRSNQRSPVGHSDTGTDSVDPETIAESVWQPEQMVDREIRIEQVRRAMKCLSREHYALVALHDIEGLTLEELHKLTGRPVGTIKSLLHRTRVKLGRLLANESILKPQLKAVGGKL